MVRLTCDPKFLYAASQTARSKLGEVTHGVDRVDKYGGSQLVAIWNGIRDNAANIARTTDKDLIKLQAAIDTFLIVHGEARNPDSLDDIIAELTEQSQALEEYDSQEKPSAQLTQLSVHIAKFTQAFVDNVATADAKVDARVKETAANARETREDLGKISGKLQDSASETLFDKALASAWSFLGLARDNGTEQANNKGGRGGKESPSDKKEKESPGQLSSDFIKKMGESEAAHQESSQATFAAIMRGKADTPATVASLAAASTAVEAWISEQCKLEETFAAVKGEVNLYLSLFVENQGKGKPASEKAQLALTRHIHKVETTSKELAAYGESLKAAAGAR